MDIGIIGLPNVGKSTLFNSLTGAGIPAENFPFTTIEPNVGVAVLPDSRLERIGCIFGPEKITPASVRFTDIAGLVKGASKGEGLGNRFLSHIREMDALVHVVRVFPGDRVVNTLGEPDPVREAETVETELILSDLEHVGRIREKLLGSAKSGDMEAREKVAVLERLAAFLNSSRPAREDGAVPDDVHLLTSRPVLYVFNTDDNTAAGTVEAAERYVSGKKGAGSMFLNIQYEYELSRLSPSERESFRTPGKGARLEDLVKESYGLLGLVTFYTVVGTEVRAWSVPAGSSAKKAAGRIHTDMEKGFIRAEVYSSDLLFEHGSEKKLREKGLVRTEGKDYTVSDGDILRIHFSR